jgi:hypothetical protein
MESVYLDREFHHKVRRPLVFSKNIMGLLLAVITLLFFAGGVSYLANHGTHKALAASTSSQESALGNGYKGLKVPAGGDTTSNVYNNAGDPPSANTNTNNIGYVLYQILGVPNYLNWAPKAVLAKGSKAPFHPAEDITGNKGLMCDYNGSHWGDNLTGGVEDYDGNIRPTLANTNCDIPNVMTELVQGLAEDVMPGGAQNATVESAKDTSFFGMPPTSSIPMGAAYQNPRKYTALELYGYKLKFTSYEGEWDNITVNTSARLLSNFGVWDDLRLGFFSITNAIGAVADGVKNDILKGIESGNPFKAVGGIAEGGYCLFSSLWGGCGAAAAALNTIIDTSNANIFVTNEWNRPDFPSTIYGAQQLSQQQTTYLILNSESQQILLALAKSKIGSHAPFQDQSDMPAKIEPKGRVAAESAAAWWHNPSVQTIINGATSEIDQSFTAGNKPPPSPTINLSDYATAQDAWIAYNNDWTTFFSSAEIQWYEQSPQYATQVVKIIDSSKVSSPSEIFDTPETTLVCSTGDISQYTSLQDIPFVFKNQFNDPNLTNGSNNLEFAQTKASIPDSGCGPTLRSPIQNGLFGSGYNCSIDPHPSQGKYGASGQCNIPPDTRNSLFSPLRALTNPINPLNGISGLGLKAAGFFTQISNTFLRTAFDFNSTMQEIGANTLIVNLVKGFTNSIFFPLLSIAVMLAALQILFKSFRSRNYMKALSDIGILFLVILSGILFLTNPGKIITASEKIPDAISSVAIRSINLGDPNPELCSAGGSQAALRTLMCENWDTFYFQPYIYGQWGTSYKNLDITEMKNAKANQDIVGTATVNFGNDIVSHNWGLFGVNNYLTGTTTTPGLGKVGETDPAFYRSVDLQAGPDNGLGTDPRYLQYWSGNDLASRAGVGVMGAIISFLGMFVVISYSMSMIVLTLTFTLLLLIAPFIFLFGLSPTAGRVKLKAYLWELVSLIFKRIVLSILLAAMMSIIITLITSAQSFWLYSIIAIAVCLTFLVYKKELLKLFSVGPSDGGGFLQHDSSDYRESYGAMSKYIRPPGAISNWAFRQKHTYTSAAGGAIGGYIAGGTAGARSEFTKLKRAETNTMQNQRLRNIGGRGMGESTMAGRAYKKGTASAEKTANQAFDERGRDYTRLDPDTSQDQLDKVDERINDLVKQNQDLEALKNLSKEEQVKEFGAPIEKNTRIRNRELNQYRELRKKIQDEAAKVTDRPATRRNPLSNKRTLKDDLREQQEDYTVDPVVAAERRANENRERGEELKEHKATEQTMKRVEELGEIDDRLEQELFSHDDPEQVREVLRKSAKEIIEKLKINDENEQ